MGKISCLITDLDGTLLFTEEANMASYDAAFREVGIRFSKKRYRHAFGLRFDEMMEQVAPGLDAKGRTLIKGLKQKHYRRNLGLIMPNLALIGFLRSARKNHKLGLATTARRANAMLALRRFKLDRLFDSMVFGEDVRLGKPYPEVYRRCIRGCGAKPSETLVFEDTEIGAMAASAAGAKVILI